MLIDTVPQVADRLVAHVMQLEQSAEPPLFRRHLASIHALVRAEEARTSAKPDLSEQSLKFLQSIERGLNADAGNWATYLNGRRSLLMAYVSKRDNSLAHYWLTLPENYDPTKSYPLYFELHGASDINPLAWADGQIGLPIDTKPEEYQRPAMVPMIERKGFHVYPYGRGNSGYDDIGMTDVLEALADVEATVRLDPKRYFLSGFSMGGGGAWKLACQHPEKWAAIAIFSPYVQPEWLTSANAATLNKTFVWIWCGADDELVKNARKMFSLLQEAGNDPRYTEVPGVGHSYTQEAQTAAARYFDNKRRE